MDAKLCVLRFDNGLLGLYTDSKSITFTCIDDNTYRYSYTSATNQWWVVKKISALTDFNEELQKIASLDSSLFTRGSEHVETPTYEETTEFLRILRDQRPRQEDRTIYYFIREEAGVPKQFEINLTRPNGAYIYADKTHKSAFYHFDSIEDFELDAEGYFKWLGISNLPDNLARVYGFIKDKVESMYGRAHKRLVTGDFGYGVETVWMFDLPILNRF
jgi:hypothetical protein